MRLVWLPWKQFIIAIVVPSVNDIICSAAASLGYSKLKPTQQGVVEKFVSGRDVFVCLPTGSEKSLCYAMLLAVFDSLRQLTDKSLVIVVSPLIALIKDQVETFTLKGLSCFYANSSDQEAKHSVLAGECKLLYISAETLLTDCQWREILQSPTAGGHFYHVNDHRSTLIIAFHLNTETYSESPDLPSLSPWKVWPN